MAIAVLGAGVSGLTAARKLQEKGLKAVVYERNSSPGGLARTRITNGFVFDPHGGHIFNSKYPEVANWVFSILPKENWTYTIRNAKIFFEGRFVSYPFELSLCELDPNTAAECVLDYIQAQNGPEPENFKDWLVWNFGKSISDYYMNPYNSKIWAYPLEDMETGWIRGKMPLPEKKELIISLLMKDPSERKMPHSTFYYPTKGGIQTMVDAIAAPLDIRYENPVEAIEHIGGRAWYINGEGPYETVISTLPLPGLPKILKLPDTVQAAISGLKYNSLNTVLFDCPPTDISWLYIPSEKYQAHRVGYQSALTPFATPGKTGSGALEIIGKAMRVDEKFLETASAIPKELQANRIIDSEFTQYAYVIHDMHYRKNTQTIWNYFNTVNNFHLLGRWGKWNYKNMDLCMLDAFELVAENFKGSTK